MKTIDPIAADEQEEHSLGGSLDLRGAAAGKPHYVPVNRGTDRTFAVIVTFAPPLALIAAIYLHAIGWYRIGWFEIIAMVTMHFLALTGLELGFHRLFAHRSYTARPIVRVVLAALGSMSFQGPPIWWAAIHRKHHRYSDQPGDPHSMYLFGTGFWAMFRGFIHSHVGWIWTKSSIRFPDFQQYVLDLYRDRGVFRVHMTYFYWMAVGFVLPAVAGALYYHLAHGMPWKGFALGALWGGFVRIFVMNHLTFWAINTVCHSLGARPYRSRTDRSTNFLPLAIPTLGQSLHNNHHAFPYSSKMGLRWFEIDVGMWVLWMLEKMGLVWDLKVPSRELMKRRKENVQ